MTYGHVAPLFASTDIIFLIGGGASATGIDLSPIFDIGRAIAINEAAFLLPTCSAVISVDQQFMSHRAARLAEMAQRVPVYLCPPEHMVAGLQVKIPAAVFLRENSTFSFDPTRIHRRGGSSGYAGLNAGVFMGGKRFVLVGYDYKRTNGRKHWHNSYTWPQNENWAAWARAFDPVAPLLKERGIEVINASPDSAVTAFPRMTFAEALNHKWRDHPQKAA